MILGLGSSGVHSNGFSLVRRVIQDRELRWTDAAPFAPGQSFGQALMTPTRIYVRSLLALHRAGLLKAAAHITGGGLPGNLPRVLPTNARAVLDRPWPMPPVFSWLARTGNVAAEEMLRVFNCGIGMALVVSDPDAAIGLLKARGETVSRIGLIEAAAGPAAVQIDLPGPDRLPVGGPPAPPRPAILISGRGSNMSALINAAGHMDFRAEIVLVLSNNRDAAGLDAARAAGIPARAIDHRPYGRDRASHEAAIDAALRETGADIVCLAGYMRLLTPFLVDAWQGRMLNIHPSLLPSFPGLHTHARALAAGVRLHGCTVHLVTHEMDAGPILAQAAVPVLPRDTEDALAARVLRQEHAIYPAALAAFAAGQPGALPGGDASMANPLPWLP